MFIGVIMATVQTIAAHPIPSARRMAMANPFDRYKKELAHEVRKPDVLQNDKTLQAITEAWHQYDVESNEDYDSAVKLVKKLKPDRVLEIGRHRGGSVVIIASALAAKAELSFVNF